MTLEILKKIIEKDKISIYMLAFMFLLISISMYAIYLSAACIIFTFFVFIRIIHIEKKLLSEDGYIYSKYAATYDSIDSGSGSPDDPVGVYFSVIFFLFVISNILLIMMHIDNYSVSSKVIVVSIYTFSSWLFVYFSVLSTAVRRLLKK